MPYQYWNPRNPWYTSSASMADDQRRFLDEYERQRRAAQAGSAVPRAQPYYPPSGFGGRTREQAGELFAPGAPGHAGVAGGRAAPAVSGYPSPAYPAGPVPVGRGPAAPPTLRAPLPPGRTGPLPPLAAFVPPPAPAVGRAREAIDALGRPITLAGARRAALGEAPGRIAAAAGLSALPARVGDWAGPWAAPDRSRLDALTDRAAAGTSIARPGRETLGGPRADNAWERASLGPMYQGREIRREVFTPAEEGLLAVQRSAATLRALEDMRRAAAEGAAGSGAFDPARAAAAANMAALQGAAAMGEARGQARVDAARANAEQEQAWAANARENFSADIGARLGMGQLGMSRRGLDQSRDIAGYQGGIAQRGQDLEAALAEGRLNADQLQAALSAELGARGQDIGYATEAGRQALTARGQDVAQREQDIGYATEAGRQALTARGQDVAQRGQEMEFAGERYRGEIAQRAQDMERQYRAAGLNAEQARARAQAELGLSEQEMQFALESGRQRLTARGQDASYAQAGRGMDIEENLGLGRLGLERYQTDARLADAAAERRNRLELLDRQLADASLDRASRERIESQRQQLERELQEINLRQQESQFARQLAFNQRGLDEGTRRYEQDFGEARRRYEQDYGLERDRLNWSAFGPPSTAPGYLPPLYSWSFGDGGGGRINERYAAARGGGAVSPEELARYGDADHLRALERALRLARAA